MIQFAWSVLMIGWLVANRGYFLGGRLPGARLLSCRYRVDSNSSTEFISGNSGIHLGCCIWSWQLLLMMGESRPLSRQCCNQSINLWRHTSYLSLYLGVGLIVRADERRGRKTKLLLERRDAAVAGGAGGARWIARAQANLRYSTVQSVPCLGCTYRCAVQYLVGTYCKYLSGSGPQRDGPWQPWVKVIASTPYPDLSAQVYSVRTVFVPWTWPILQNGRKLRYQHEPISALAGYLR